MQSRYYDAEVGRFLNADEIELIGSEFKDTNDYGLFAYCKNDCVNISDDSGYGAVDILIGLLQTSLNVVENIIRMIANSYRKEMLSLQNSVKLLTKQQARRLKGINELRTSAKKIIKRIGWVGNLLLFFTMATILTSAFKSGASIDRAILDCGIEALIDLICKGATFFFKKISKYIPYVGFLISVIGGLILQYALYKIFNSKFVARVKSKFAVLIRGVRLTYWNWFKMGLKSLTG